MDSNNQQTFPCPKLQAAEYYVQIFHLFIREDTARTIYRIPHTYIGSAALLLTVYDISPLPNY